VDARTGELLDRGLVTTFHAPSSYTGEDMAELSCHGGWLTPVLVIDAALGMGCRAAEPGEFTRRAYLNGKMDLVQAEAVLDLVDGRSRALRRAALGHLERGLSQRVGALRQELVHLEALLAHHIDFPEEDDAPVPATVVADRAEGVCTALTMLLQTAPEGELLREGAVTVLAGLANTGKSSLFNVLLGEERAIVTEVPGTTRDAIEAVVALDGYPFRLIDTAGIRSTDELVERIGVEVARRYVQRADVVLLCVDTRVGVGTQERAFVSGLSGVPVVVVRTKTDLSGHDHGSASGGAAGGPGEYAAVVGVSSETGEGVAELKRTLAGLVYGGLATAAPDLPVLTRRRHRDALRVAHDEVADFARALREGVPAEVAATHLRPAETALEELLGVISVDDVLDRVFEDFCIGK
jgi:tRNA modification GTPase